MIRKTLLAAIVASPSAALACPPGQSAVETYVPQMCETTMMIGKLILPRYYECDQHQTRCEPDVREFDATPGSGKTLGRRSPEEE